MLIFLWVFGILGVFLYMIGASFSYELAKKMLDFHEDREEDVTDRTFAWIAATLWPAYLCLLPVVILWIFAKKLGSILFIWAEQTLKQATSPTSGRGPQ